MKSLPSTYRGVLFRSRLEARWAALFDMFGMTLAYEPEGFETPSGNYLPDFYLPKQNCYVEVKPAPGLADNIAITSVHEQTKADFLVLDSPVVQCRAYPILGAWWPDKWNDTSWCTSGKYLIGRNSFEDRFFIDLAVPHNPPASSVACPNCDGDGLAHCDGMIVAARNLRFENGVAR